MDYGVLIIKKTCLNGLPEDIQGNQVHHRSNIPKKCDVLVFFPMDQQCPSI